jgi:hypothetical protein
MKKSRHAGFLFSAMCRAKQSRAESNAKECFDARQSMSLAPQPV